MKNLLIVANKQDICSRNINIDAIWVWAENTVNSGVLLHLLHQTIEFFGEPPVPTVKCLPHDRWGHVPLWVKRFGNCDVFAQFVSHQLCKCQGLVSSGKKTWKRLGRLHSLKLTQPLKICHPKRKPDRLPTINFQVRAISFREGTLQEPKPQNSHEKKDCSPGKWMDQNLPNN